MPPVVPLALLDQPEAGSRLAAALAGRALATDVRTVNRELSALRSAVGWWQDQQWIGADPTAGLRNVAGPAAPVPALTGSQVADLFRVPVTLREQAFWRVLYDSAAHVDEVLSLNADRLDLRGRAAPVGRAAREPDWIHWGDAAGQLLGWLLAGRPCGPVFLDRPAGAGPGRAVRRLPGDRARPDVLPAGRGDLHRGYPPARPGGPGLDPGPAAPGRPGSQRARGGG